MPSVNVVAFVIIAALCSQPLRAQTARIGRLPVLALPSTDHAACTRTAGSPALRRDGVDRIYNLRDSLHHRLLSLVFGPDGRPRMLEAMVSSTDGRRSEGESVTVFFTVSGSIERGTRRAFTAGTPARLSEDRQSGLLLADTPAVTLLVRTLRQICRA